MAPKSIFSYIICDKLPKSWY